MSAATRSLAAALRKEAGLRIAARRRDRGWTQRRLAAEAGVAQSTVSLAETGIPLVSEEAVQALACVFAASLSDLLGQCGNCLGNPPARMRCRDCGTEGPE